MGSWTSTGEYIPGKVEAAQQEKNRLRKRAGVSENAMRRIRAILENPLNESDTEIVEAVIDTLEQWEDDMDQRERCGHEANDVRCSLPVGHKSRHVGTDGSNKRHDWVNSPPGAEPAEAGAGQRALGKGVDA